MKEPLQNSRQINDRKQFRSNLPNSYNQSMLNKIAEEQHDADEKV